MVTQERYAWELRQWQTRPENNCYFTERQEPGLPAQAIALKTLSLRPCVG